MHINPALCLAKYFPSTLLSLSSWFSELTDWLTKVANSVHEILCRSIHNVWSAIFASSAECCYPRVHSPASCKLLLGPWVWPTSIQNGYGGLLVSVKSPDLVNGVRRRWLNGVRHFVHATCEAWESRCQASGSLLRHLLCTVIREAQQQRANRCLCKSVLYSRVDWRGVMKDHFGSLWPIEIAVSLCNAPSSDYIKYQTHFAWYGHAPAQPE